MVMRVLLLLVLSVSTGLAFGQQGSYWDLKRCVEYGMNNNITVRQAKIQADQSEINYQQSNLQRIPS
ncbi:MAG: hypothetical protein RL675_785, partial [Bacteroidota bacterium]